MTHPVKSPRKLIRGALLLDAIEHDTVDGPYSLRHPFDAEPGWGVGVDQF